MTFEAIAKILLTKLNISVLVKVGLQMEPTFMSRLAGVSQRSLPNNRTYESTAKTLLAKLNIFVLVEVGLKFRPIVFANLAGVLPNVHFTK